MKVYIAAPFFTPDQIDIVLNVEQSLRRLNINYFSPRSAGVLKEMSKEEQQKTKGDIFKGNIDSMDDCTHMIACIEHKDTGTSFEIGYYYSKGKPIVLYSDDLSRVNVMLAEAGTLCDSCGDFEDAFNGLSNCKIGDYT